MPVHFRINPIHGHATKSVRAGELAQIVVREFLTSEDGMDLVLRLENLTRIIQAALPPGVILEPSKINHMLLHFSADGDAVLYVNECRVAAHVRARNAVSAGAAVSLDDITDIERLSLGVEVPPTHAVVLVFSQGWRKFLYSDYSPVHPDAPSRTFELDRMWGGCLNYLVFREVFALTEDDWAALFAEDWFPFMGLNHEPLGAMLGWVRSGRSADEILQQAADGVTERLDSMKAKWHASTLFASHALVLDSAVERFRAGDWLAASAIIYPRIEGILRTFTSARGGKQFGQDVLAGAPATIASLPSVSRVFPSKFETYLREVYFRSFTPEEEPLVSRHSVSHGVVRGEALGQKAAVIGFLVLEQIMFHVPTQGEHEPT